MQQEKQLNGTKSSKETKEIEFSVAEAYRVCELYQEEDVLLNQNLADYSNIEKKYARPSPVTLDSESSTCNSINIMPKETLMSSFSMLKLSPGI